MRISLFLFISFVLHSNLALSEVYKWIDENGKTVYGDKPVSENANVIEIKKQPTTDKAYQKRIEKQQKLLDVMQDERTEKQASQKQEQTKKEKQQQQCAKLRNQLQEAKNASFIYEDTDDPDNPRIYSDKERQVEMSKYEKYIKENC